MKVLIIPDLHGHLDALEAMLRVGQVVDARGRLRTRGPWVVQLGDMLDRGPRPRACVERLMALTRAVPERVHVLMGNHEDMALRCHKEPELRRLWLLNGGTETLRDYDVKPALLKPGGAHYRWLHARPRYLLIHDVLFCHAGLARSRGGQLDPKGLLWDRPPLTRGPYRAVVSGHNPTASGRVESRAGLFHCDIGLGHGLKESVECLLLDLSAHGMASQVLKV